jgi:hypothetical protein
VEVVERAESPRRIGPLTPLAPVRLPGTRPHEAYDLYLKGRYFWNKRTPEGFRQAADYFQQAIKKVSIYAQPMGKETRSGEIHT